MERDETLSLSHRELITRIINEFDTSYLLLIEAHNQEVENAKQRREEMDQPSS